MKKTLIILAVSIVLLVSGFICYLVWETRCTRVATAKEIFKTAITHKSSEDRKTEVLARCSELLELNFPPSTKLLFACVTKGDLDLPYVCSIKLQINKDELDVFIEEINKHSEINNHVLSSKVRSGLINNFNFSFFNPNDVWQAKKVKNKQTHTIIYDAKSGCPVSTVLIDLDNPENPIIYFGYARV